MKDQSSTADCQLIDNEYYVAFDSLNEVEQFHSRLIDESQSKTTTDYSSNELDLDMKSFAEQFLIDCPEATSNDEHKICEASTQNIPTTTQPRGASKRKQAEPSSSMTKINSKRARRHVRDLPQSSSFVYMLDNEPSNIFDSISQRSSTSPRSKRIAYEDINSVLLTLTTPQKDKTDQATIGLESAEPSAIIKNEPTESDQPVISDVVEAKEEPVESSYVFTRPMGFGTAVFCGHLDNYVQNIHRSRSNQAELTETITSRPKRIRRRKKLYIEESESIVTKKKIRKKSAPLKLPSSLFTDAEIEQEFGERLSPTIKSEPQEENTINSRMIIEIEPVDQTPIERARAKLLKALRRGQGPDEFLLKLRSRENKIVEIQLAIYGTADWHGQRIKILSKIEEALRGLRVSWTKVDIRVDEFDIEICTSRQATSVLPPATLNNNNSSWFLKVLSESGPLIVHIHDRRRPEQRLRIKCPCPHCSPSEQKSSDSSLPIIVNVSPSKVTPVHHSPPTILRRTSSTLNSNLSSLQMIHTTFFKDLIHHYGTNTVSSVTQCVLDLTLIVSVHASIDYLQKFAEHSAEVYREKYQQIIDPLKYTNNEQENFKSRKINGISLRVNQPNILTFYQTIQTNRANIRSAQAMKNVINCFISTSIVNKKSFDDVAFTTNESNSRESFQTARTFHANYRIKTHSIDGKQY